MKSVLKWTGIVAALLVAFLAGMIYGGRSVEIWWQEHTAAQRDAAR